jgi:hypothetical protein
MYNENNKFDDLSSSDAVGYFNNLSPNLRAVAIFAVPFIVADFFNYYSAGAALVFSLPILAIIYTGCGALAAKHELGSGGYASSALYTGAKAGLTLWLTSTIVNTLISLLIGAASFGTTLLLGVPYLCLCAPLQLFGGGTMGALGGFIYDKVSGKSGGIDYDDYSY